MKKILVILTICILSITGCSKGDNQSFEKYMEEGRIAVANQEYDKALNFFTLALEENKDDTDAKSLYNQTKNLVEAIDSKDKKNYTVAIQLCDVISNMESNTNIIKDAAENVKKESNELMEKAQRQDKEKTQAKEENIKENISNDTNSGLPAYLGTLGKRDIYHDWQPRCFSYRRSVPQRVPGPTTCS